MHPRAAWKPALLVVLPVCLLRAAVISPEELQEAVVLDVDVNFEVPSRQELNTAGIEPKHLAVITGMFEDIKKMGAEARSDNRCENVVSDGKSRPMCPITKRQLYEAASLQFEAAQILRNLRLATQAMPLFASACVGFAASGVDSNLALVWNIGLDMQHEARYLDALAFYQALRSRANCTAHRTEATALGHELADMADRSPPRPECVVGGGDGGLRVKGFSAPADVEEDIWTKDLPEFCPVLDITSSRHGPQEFLEKYILQSKPVILRGLPPLNKPFQPGDGLLRGLAKDYGEEVVTAWATPNGQFYGSETDSTAERPARPAEVPLKLKDVVRLLQHNASELGMVLYGQHINVDKEIPGLGRALYQAQHAHGSAQLLSALPLRLINLWLAPTEQTLFNGLHWDGHDSLFYQLQCGKEFLLFPPGDKENLPYVPLQAKKKDKAALQWKFNITGGDIKWWLEQLPQGIHNAAVITDLSKPDFERFPALKDVWPPKKCTVRAGDAMFLPAYWHHQVRSFSGKDSGDRCKCVNAAVNFWYRPLYTDAHAAEAAAASLARADEL